MTEVRWSAEVRVPHTFTSPMPELHRAYCLAMFKIREAVERLGESWDETWFGRDGHVTDCGGNQVRVYAVNGWLQAKDEATARAIIGEAFGFLGGVFSPG